jgi:hypothetical protein
MLYKEDLTFLQYKMKALDDLNQFEEHFGGDKGANMWRSTFKKTEHFAGVKYDIRVMGK